jgi:hypothetical protein
MQKKTKGETPKAKVEIPIHEALEEYLLSGPTPDNLTIQTHRHFDSCTISRGLGKVACRWRSSASWQKLELMAERFGIATVPQVAQ